MKAILALVAACYLIGALALSAEATTLLVR
jgi:hypothetical protein